MSAPTNGQDGASATPAGGAIAPVADQSALDQAVVQGGAYEVLSRRLGEQGNRLRTLAEALNAQRIGEFGSSEMAVVGRLRVRSENNCVGRDVVQVGELTLFGYNVFIGLKKETQVGDVFALYRLVEGADGYDAAPVPLAGSFLADPGFASDFRELYAYYKNTRLLQLVVRDGLLLASFQIGERITDTRVFRWSVSPDGAEVRYVDNRGERDVLPPAPFDFEWTPATRDMLVNGRHPHLNILDRVFVETVGGDLTIKVEDNTEDGQGIYREAVDDATQSLDDAQVAYAELGSLLLLKVLPYREQHWRYLVFDALAGKVTRIDAIGLACIQLPEDHGIIFPGGYYLRNGETKAFEQSMQGMRFRRAIRSPNGEDVLYVFYEPESGRIALFDYNMIERRLQTPIVGHGYARLDDGRIAVFSAEGDEPTRVHAMQIWKTPFTSDEFAARQPTGAGFLARIGNAELVRGLSDLMSLSREIGRSDVSTARYEQLTQATQRVFDLHHWVDDAHSGGVGAVLREIVATSESVLDEFEKVQSIRAQSAQALADAEARAAALAVRLYPDNWTQVHEFVDALAEIGALRGHLLTIRESRYIDVARIDAMEASLVAEHARIGSATGAFLAGDRALQPFVESLKTIDAQAQQAAGVAQLAEPLVAMQAMAADLDTLSGLMTTLRVDDAAQRTRIVESISGIYASLNQARARAEQRRKALGSGEAVAEFGAQFSLFGQSIASALGLAVDPERCDEQLSKLLVQLEEIEGRFGEHEQFLGDILSKREELLETFESHKQALLDERQRKAQGVLDAAQRILDGLARRTARFANADELNAFFAGDPLILKLRELSGRLRTLKDSVKADDVEARLKGARDQAVRALRDRSELFEAGGDVIRLGPRHRFSVNTQELDLTLLPRGDALALHLTGTDYMEALPAGELDALRDYWTVSLDSESPQLYRGEYLAGLVLAAAQAQQDGLSMDALRQQASQLEALTRTVRDFAAPRYREGYEKGIHDHDAARLLQALLPLVDGAGTLVFEPAARALALVAWAHLRAEAQPAQWPERARTARGIEQLFGSRAGLDALRDEIAAEFGAFTARHPLPVDAALHGVAAQYLVAELSADAPRFTISTYAGQLLDALRARLSTAHAWDGFVQTQALLADRPAAQWGLARDWLDALCRQPEFAPLSGYAVEAVAALLVADALAPAVTTVALRVEVDGLLGEHPRIDAGRMSLGVDDFNARLHRHRTQFVPAFQRYQALRQQVIARERAAMRLDEFKPRPLSSFVRNRLINDAYLPVIGDNLAKQIGTAGEGKRSDLMGLLLMISPPGYGKTTLMEYVAHRLGLVFMKINGPALGHGVRSLDPAQAPDATSRQELHKLNLALEMGNNVMLYVDDIQHTHPEFLQKFISLCDGTRRIEGVWKGTTRTYDMRGKKFCVVMAGNPYTESGEVFKIPDMLANRADIYNLGDVLGGMEEAFKLSYIENSLTANPVLAPLATRDMADLYRFVDKALGRAFSATTLSHGYGSAEIDEIVATLQRLMQARDVVYRVNQQYIASAAQADGYRTEPPFRLQGSYRNMNKLAEKISPAMNDAELQQLLADHYVGEAQLLTSGTEENLLKLAELRGAMDATQAARWAQIKRDFMRSKAMGGDDADAGQRVVAQLADLVEGVRALQPDTPDVLPDVPPAAAAVEADGPPWADILQQLSQHIAQLAGQQASSAARVDANAEAATEQAALRREAAASSEQALASLPDALETALQPLVEGLQLRAEQQARLLAEIAERLRDAPVATGRTEGGTTARPAKPSAHQLDMERALAEFAERLAKRDKRRKAP